jgi:hypothetical protein
MKKLTIKLSICVLFVGLLALIESNARGYDSPLGICVADNNSAPSTIACDATSIQWITGTAHCHGTGANSDCWPITITVTLHTESVTWIGNKRICRRSVQG